jgi:hypothetical protein
MIPAPALIEVRYKPYSKLDYVSGYSYLYSTKDLPTWNYMMRNIDDEYNEISIRVLPLSDLIVFAYDAHNAAEEQAEIDMFYDIVGQPQPEPDFIEIDRPTEITIEGEEEVVPYTVLISPKAEKELLKFYYLLKEIDPEE